MSALGVSFARHPMGPEDFASRPVVRSPRVLP